MSYILTAFVGQRDPLYQALADFGNAHVVVLSQEFGLVPITNEFFDEMSEWDVEDAANPQSDPYKEFWFLSPSVEKVGKAISLRTPVAYFEVEYHHQRVIADEGAVVWDGGAVVLGPLWEDQQLPPEPP